MKTKTLTKKLNRVLTLVLTLAALMVGQSMWAQEPTSGNCGKTGNDNVTWEVTDEDNNGTYETITINGTGAMADYDSNSQPWVAFKENITTAVIGEGVTSIGETAFATYANLTSVTFAEGSHLESIGFCAFNCCTNLTAITIPENVTSIGGFAFGDCYNLTKFTLLGSKVIFGANVFVSTGLIYIYAPIDILDSYYLQFPELGISPDRLVGMLTAKEGEPGEYWTSLWSGAYNYKVPSDTKIYKAAVSGTKLVLTELTKDKVVGMGESVILKTTSPAILLPGYVGGSTNDFSGNQLTVGNIELMNPDNVYVLDVKEGTGVGLYRLSANEIDSAPEVYLEYSGSPACEVFPIPFSFTNLQAKLTASSTDADAPTVITLDRDVVAESGDERLLITYNHHVIIDLNGHTIDRHLSAATGDGHVINVRNNASLVIRDSQGGGQITGGYTSTTGGGITVSGTLTLEGGTICGNRSQNNGGGLSVSGTFIMTGGTITNNTCTGNYGKGSAIYASQGTARLQGGTITGNYGQNAIYTDRNMTVSGTYDVSGNFIKAVEVNPNVAPDIVLFGSVINIAAAISPLHPAIVTFENSSQTIVTSGWSTHMGNTLADDYFTPSSNDRVNFIYNNEVVFATTAQKEEMLSGLYAITLPDDITTASPAAIVSNKHYYAAGSTVTLDYTGAAPAEGYIRAIYVNDVLATDNGDGTYTATMPAEDATVTIGQIAIPWSGSGDSANDPYLIQYPSQLDLLAKMVNGTDGYTANDFSGKYFALANDITYSHTTDWNDANSTENNYTAIGTDDHSFQGTFDGQGYTISGIRIYMGGDASIDVYQGVFGLVGFNGIVQNLTVSNANITGLNYVGGIAGINNGTVKNCHATATVFINAVQDDTDCHGGIAGFNGGKILACTSSVTLSVKEGCTNCKSFGGICGRQSSYGAKIYYCLSVGVVLPSVEFAEPIVGYSVLGNVSYCLYHDCSIGVGSGLPCYTVTCDTGITATAVGSIIDTNTYDGIVLTADAKNNCCISYGGTTYCSADITITLSGMGSAPTGYQEPFLGYSLDGTPFDGDSFKMPANNVTVTDRWSAIRWAGSGTEDNPWQIQYPSQLDLLATRVNSGNDYQGKFFKLANDITYDGTENNYTPIGTVSYYYYFCGTFDGDGHTISGINIHTSADCQGLFGYVNDGTVKNVTLANSTIIGHAKIGGIVGYIYDGTVQNCLAIGATVSSNSYKGAIVGLNDHGTLANNYYYNCTVNGATENIGTGTSGDISDNDGAVKVSSVLSDTETVPTDLDGKVVFRREFTGGKASTICLPFAHEKDTEGSYYTFGGVAYDDVEGKWKATMNEVSGTTLAANTPYLFMPAGSEAHTPVLFHGTASYNTAGTTDNGDWSFVGVYERKTWTAADCGRDYGFAATSGKATDGVTDVEAGDFVKLAEGAWIRPMRSYLTYIGSGNPFAAPKHRAGTELPSSISVILVSANGETTEISDALRLNDKGQMTNDNFYDLQGRKIEKPTKGLYIHNGKMVVIK